MPERNWMIYAGRDRCRVLPASICLAYGATPAGPPGLIVWRWLFAVGWECTLRVRFNADVFQAEDIANLMMHAGDCVGVGDGRDLSPKSKGMGWGNWKLLNREEAGA